MSRTVGRPGRPASRLRGLDALAYLDVTSLRGTTLTSRQVELLATVFARAAGIDVQD